MPSFYLVNHASHTYTQAAKNLIGSKITTFYKAGVHHFSALQSCPDFCSCHMTTVRQQDLQPRSCMGTNIGSWQETSTLCYVPQHYLQLAQHWQDYDDSILLKLEKVQTCARTWHSSMQHAIDETWYKHRRDKGLQLSNILHLHFPSYRKWGCLPI